MTMSAADMKAYEDRIAQLKIENELRRRKHNREKALRSPRGRYLHPKPKSLVVRLLDLIEERGGMTTGQMSEQLWNWSHPDIAYDKTKGRSRWGTHLYGSESLLRFYCKKVGRKWVRNAVDHEGQPWRVLRAKVRQRRKQYQSARTGLLPGVAVPLVTMGASPVVTNVANP